jgi:hypothetical protein
LNDNYYELHHTWPTALGGPDTEDNHAYLTAKEHFVVHLLLPKFLNNPEKAQMQFALANMLKIPKKMQGLRYMPTGRTFEIARGAAAEGTRDNKEIAAKISASHIGKVLSEETKRKISEGLKGKYTMSAEHAAIVSATHKGKPKSEASKEKLKLAWVARRERIAAGLEPRKPMTDQAKKNIAEGKRGKALSPEHRAKISAGLLSK